jgi:hypothetical protein
VEDEVSFDFLGRSVTVTAGDAEEIQSHLASERSIAALAVAGKLKQVLERTLFVREEAERHALIDVLSERELSERQAQLRDVLVIGTGIPED